MGSPLFGNGEALVNFVPQIEHCEYRTFVCATWGRLSVGIGRRNGGWWITPSLDVTVTNFKPGHWIDIQVSWLKKALFIHWSGHSNT